ncbi:endonuclease/exonuclease/phosphatase family protein, partial [gut metagenome]
MSYNVENMLDTIDNPSKMDEEFTPDGTRHWSSGRYWKKQRHIAKVITAAGGWEAPALVALCEVENDSVIKDLTNRTPLRQEGYRYVITNGPDFRGINVALLYQRDKFRLLGHESLRITFSSHRKRGTREILHVYGEVITHDTLDIFVCHFPSRYGGEKESESNRIDAALRLKMASDSISASRG